MSVALSVESKRSNVRKKPLSHAIKMGANSLLFVVVALVAIVSFLYLAHANRNATKGYSLKSLEQQRGHLMVQNEILDMQIAQIRSLDALQNDPKILSMRRADQPQFVRGDTAVAQR